ncbi:MAG TPA: hypothetical protein VM733_20485 [Thermoanaerobaculia bacterium]|nr:hypothetical protein [Thermoanaerobaculia bacterium]
MGTLTVYFVGICTHLREFTSRETEHRVVLVNAREGREINKTRIVAHTPSLIYPDAGGKEQRVDLNGVHITVNAASPKVDYDRSFFRCIPRLTAYAPKLTTLATAVANGKDADLVSAYFDAAGRFIARADSHGASVAILNVVTHDPPTLTLANFDGTSRPIELADGDEIQIENVGPGVAVNGGDRTEDFLLHYLVAQGIPTDAGVPAGRAECMLIEKLPFPTNTVDVGCSNSNYP